MTANKDFFKAGLKLHGQMVLIDEKCTALVVLVHSWA